MNQRITYQQTSRPGCLIQLVWYWFLGWWLGLIWVSVAWFLMLTVIGFPFAAAMLNNVPQVIALRGRRVLQVSESGVREVPQINILIRALWFVVFGWWFSAIWMAIAYLLCLSIIGLPFGFWMFDLTPTVVSLRR
ncbi:MAG: YccF domain-containing protein [Anaerolineae bacterium]|nr:YccF domain-containing protein [Anaerolineae bacterium]